MTRSSQYFVLYNWHTDPCHLIGGTYFTCDNIPPIPLWATQYLYNMPYILLFLYSGWRVKGLSPLYLCISRIELYILTRALTCSAFWSHPARRHVWCVAWIRNFKRTHIAAIILHFACAYTYATVHLLRPRYENRNFDLIAVLTKVNAPFNHDAHDARSLCADQQIVRFIYCIFCFDGT